MSDQPLPDPHATIAAQSYRKSRGLWRVLAFIALAVAIIVGLGRFAWPDRPGSDYVARLVIDGTIATDRDRLDAIEQLAEDETVKAVIVAINSPGGTTAGTMELAADIAAAGAAKPCYGFIEDMGASAAYWALSQTKKLYANAGAMTASIGTISIVYDTSKAFDLAGIKTHVVSTGPMKGAFADGTEITKEQLAYYQGIIDEINSFFISGVAKGRGMSQAAVRELADGSVMMASKAQKAGLIDEVSTLDNVISDLRRKGKSAAKANKSAAARMRAKIDLEEAR